MDGSKGYLEEVDDRIDPGDYGCFAEGACDLGQSARKRLRSETGFLGTVFGSITRTEAITEGGALESEL